MRIDERMFKAVFASAQRGDANAAFKVGRHFAAGRDFDRALRWFLAASKAGHRDAAAEVGYIETRQLASNPDPARGVAALRTAADAGHSDSCIQLAKLMLEGRWLEFELESLLRWILSARQAVHPETLHLEALLTPAAGQDLAAALRSWFELKPVTPTVLRAAPLLAYIDHGLPVAACAWLRQLAMPRLQPALVYNPATGQRYQDPTRSNSAANLGVLDLNTVLIEWRLLARVELGTRLARSEHVSVLHYAVGQEYKPHRDYLNPGGQPDQFPPHGPGQRTRTAFAYLSDVEAGGQTDFPQLGQRIEPREGRVVVFDNVDASGKPDPSTLHASLPVERGEKWLATLWIREGWVR